MILVKTCYVPHENANLVFPIIEGSPVMDIVWVWRPFPWWKKISRRVYLKKLKKFRRERKETMIGLAMEFTLTGNFELIFGVKNNEAPSLWEMVNTWRKHGPRNFDRSI